MVMSDNRHRSKQIGERTQIMERVTQALARITGRPCFETYRRCLDKERMPIGSQVFPVVAGQVGVGVCKREVRRVVHCELYWCFA